MLRRFALITVVAVLAAGCSGGSGGALDDLIEQVDFVSFHVPRTEETAGMLGAAQFERAPAGLLVVNAARGGIVDEDALLAALESKSTVNCVNPEVVT